MVGVLCFKKTECSVLGKCCTKKSVSCQYDSDDELITERDTIK